jgi:Protein of unknown function (DUF2934)
MAKKQAIANESAAAAAPARAAKPKTPRVTAVQHSKTASVEAPVVHTENIHTENVHAETVHSQTAPAGAADHHHAIAVIAYSYWESRGFQHGMHLDDWLRAEREYSQRNN